MTVREIQHEKTAVLEWPIPLLANLSVTARFEDGEVLFDEVDPEPIHLASFAAWLPPGFEGFLDPYHCVARGRLCKRILPNPRILPCLKNPASRLRRTSWMTPSDPKEATCLARTDRNRARV